MARGNDGNLMQHAIEAKLISQLVTDRGLHLITTHSMAPFEPLDPRKKTAQHQARSVHWWERAQAEEQADEPCVVNAYRGTRQRVPDMYPNTAEIAAELAGRGNLQGQLIEICPEKCKRLNEAWANTEVGVVEGSWRDNPLDSLPEGLDRPWLLSLDPMSYVPEHNKDDDRFHPDDFNLLATAMERLCATQRPGAMGLFCYSMRPAVQEAFRRAADD